MQYLKKLLGRLFAAYQVLRGHSIPIPIFDSDTSIFVVETDGSQVTYFKAVNLIAEDSSYCLDISKVVLWVATKPRFFWKADPLGAKVLEQASINMEEHENNSDNML